MATSVIKANNTLPVVDGWVTGFYVPGLGLLIQIPMDTRKYSVAVTTGGNPQIYLDAQGWVSITGTAEYASLGTFTNIVYPTPGVSGLTPRPYLCNIPLTYTTH